MDIVIVQGRVLGVVSFTTGFVPCKKPLKRLSEADVLSRALWLEKHDRQEEADWLIDRWCSGQIVFST